MSHKKRLDAGHEGDDPAYVNKTPFACCVCGSTEEVKTCGK